MKYGRVDASGPEDCPEEGRLPGKVSSFTGVFGCFLVILFVLKF